MRAVNKEEGDISSGEMLDRSTSWSLACDNALLNRLKAFSETIAKTSHELTKEFDNVSKDISTLNYRVLNATNEFLMLSNNQFVENRVEEFEEFGASLSSSSVVTSVTKTKAEKETELISKMKQAIQLGLTACNNKSLRTENGGSTSRFATARPYLIGSPKFFSSKYCGLVDESVRYVPYYESDFPENDSIDSGKNSENDKVAHANVGTQNTRPVTGPKTEVMFTMPPPSAYSVALSDQKNTAHTPSNSNISEDVRNTARTSPSPSDASSDKRKSVASSAARENIPQSVTDELKKIHEFFLPPPALEDDSDDDFRPNASASRLFDDDDNDIFGENDLFATSRKHTNYFSHQNPSTSNIITPVFTGPPPVNSVPHSTPPNTDVEKVLGPKPKIDTDSNDIPSVKSVFPRSKKEDSITGDEPKAATEPKASTTQTRLPAGAVSVFGSLPPPAFQNGAFQQSYTTKTVSPTSAPSKHETQIVPSSTEPSSGRNKSVRPDSLTTKQSENLNRLPKKVPTSSLFADDSSEEDLFLPTKKQQQLPVNKTRSGKVSGFEKAASIKPITHPSSVILDSKEKELKIPNVCSNFASGKKSIFDESDSDDNLFSSKTINLGKPQSSSGSASKNIVFQSESKPRKFVLPVKVAKTASLFGDDSDSDSDLFGNKKKKTIVKKLQGLTTISSTEPSKASPLDSSRVPKMAGVATDVIADQTDHCQSKGFLDSSNFKEGKGTEPCVIEPITMSNDSENNNVITESRPQITTEEECADNVTVTIKIRPKSPNITNATSVEKSDVVNSNKGETQIKKSIFDESDSDDDIFKSMTVKLSKKNSDNQFTFDEKEIDDKINKKPSPPKEVVETPKVSKKSSSLFGNDSDSDSELFLNKKSSTQQVEKSDLGHITKSAFEEPSKNACDTKNDAETVSVCDDIDPRFNMKETDKKIKGIVDKEVPKTSTDDIFYDKGSSAKSTGIKISEKIKAMQSGPQEGEGEKDDKIVRKPIKSKVSVKNLALNLNINPLALKVGAKPPKPSSSSNTPTPTGDNDPLSLITDASETIEDTMKQSNLGEVSTVDDDICARNLEEGALKENDDSSSSTIIVNDGEDHFVDIIKARAKIQRKRRPPSKGFLRSLGVQKEEVEKDDEPEQVSVKEPMNDAT